MTKVKIITDSTVDLNIEDLKRLDIEVIPLLVVFGNETFRDGIDITGNELYAEVEKYKTLPKTASISTEVFKERFKYWLDQGYQIIYTGISGKLSGTFSCAVVAAEEIGSKDIKVIDAKNLSSGSGLVVLKAAKFAQEGCTIEEIEEKLLNIIPFVRTLFAIDTLEYLHKGGRCSSLAHFFGKIFNIHPIIRVANGAMGVYKKPRGKIVNAWNELLVDIRNDLQNDNVDLDHIMITHSDSPEGVKYLYGEMAKLVDPKCIMITTAGCVIGSHCGKNTIGILYIAKK